MASKTVATAALMVLAFCVSASADGLAKFRVDPVSPEPLSFEVYVDGVAFGCFDYVGGVATPGQAVFSGAVREITARSFEYTGCDGTYSDVSLPYLVPFVPLVVADLPSTPPVSP